MICASYQHSTFLEWAPHNLSNNVVWEEILLETLSRVCCYLLLYCFEDHVLDNSSDGIRGVEHESKVGKAEFKLLYIWGTRNKYDWTWAPPNRRKKTLRIYFGRDKISKLLVCSEITSCFVNICYIAWYNL